MAGMKIVSRWVLSILGSLCHLACGISEIGEFVRDDGNGVWTGPSGAAPSVSQSVVYVTVFDYPDGYDWRSNPQKGIVRCSLVVFADFKPVLKIPVGDAYCVSDDPDMHRMMDGHLYTDYSSESETVIKRDGKPLLSFDGREAVVAMCVKGDSVHTLGQKRDAGGFAYRLNGTPVLERDDGHAFGRLSDNSGDVCLAFCEKVGQSENGWERYYCYIDGVVSQTALREDIRKVWDILIHDGNVYCLATLTGISDPVLISPGGVSVLSMPAGTTMVTGQLFIAGEVPGVEMVLEAETWQTSAIWLENRIYCSFDVDMTVSSLLSSGDGVACVLNSRSADGGGTIFRMGESFTFPEGYACIGGSPMVMADGILNVGLSSLSGGRPVVWRDGEMEEPKVPTPQTGPSDGMGPKLFQPRKCGGG